MRSRGTKKTSNGSKAIRPSLRLGLYLRDGLACVWCGQAVEDGVQLSLDHVIPESQGGPHTAANSVRQARSAADFAAACALYLDGGIAPQMILDHIQDRLATDLAPHRAEAREMLKRRGTVPAVLAAGRRD